MQVNGYVDFNPQISDLQSEISEPETVMNE